MANALNLNFPEICVMVGLAGGFRGFLDFGVFHWWMFEVLTVLDIRG
jgi:hypothetical protein